MLYVYVQIVPHKNKFQIIFFIIPINILSKSRFIVTQTLLHVKVMGDQIWLHVTSHNLLNLKICKICICETGLQKYLIFRNLENYKDRNKSFYTNFFIFALR